MGAVTRLLTFVDLDADDPGPDARSMSVSARHEAVLADGRRVLLLDDRGWGGTLQTAWLDGEPSPEERRRVELDSPGIWAHETVEGLKQDARMVVGPDEPYGDHSWAEMEAGHWGALAGILREHGVEVSAGELMTLPHDVELSDGVLARIGHGRHDTH